MLLGTVRGIFTLKVPSSAVTASPSWQARKGAGGEQAAKAFIKVFERKLFESPSDNDLSWTMWYFPTINTTDSLQVIDRYAQECLRWMISGKRTKSRFNVRYEQLRQLGLRSLVNEYYSHRKRSK